MKISRGAPAIVLAGLLLAGCGRSEEAAPPGTAAAQGRQETRAIRNTENVGYSGNAVGEKLDAALDANAQRSGQLEDQLGESAAKRQDGE